MSIAQKINYLENRDYFTAVEIKVLKILKKYQPLTLEQIVKISGDKHQSISGAISYLYKKGAVKIRETIKTNGTVKSIYEICTLEEATHRRSELKKHLTELIQDHKKALAILKEATPLTSEFLSKKIKAYQIEIQRLKFNKDDE